MRHIKDVVFTLKLERQLRDDFMEATTKAKRTASDVVRECMREYIGRKHQEANYLDYLRDRIDTARVIATDGDFIPADVAVELFAGLRGVVANEADE